ncbi:PDZ domain-containing protein [Chitinophaga sp. CB10]|uniref:PDZ domain-containing protein n=1 Tax=Chitinophaga sp. CB10 TaxID=1891659 RepID=UPI0025C63E41|nr:PDZ domain-containing protein [Chitinophaga sp. CB10]
MSKLLQTLSIAGFTCFSLLTGSVQAQQSKDKLGEFDEIIIKRKGNSDGKVTVEIKNGEVFVDGQKVDNYNNPDISVFRRKVTPVDGNTLGMSGSSLPSMNGFNFFNDDDAGEGDAPEVFNIKPNKALLGVITEKEEAAGVTVKSVSPNSPAAKAGIKPGDVITRIDARKISEPKELYETIGTYDPGDKITVTYTRNKKETQATVTLDERKEQGGMGLMMPSPDRNRGFFNFQRPDLGDNFFFRGGSSVRLGLQVEDTEDGKGAKVTDVEEGSAAEKAGFRNDDIVTEFGGTTVKSARDVANAYRANQQRSNITAKVIRNGATETLEVKIPKKINKVNL